MVDLEVLNGKINRVNYDLNAAQVLYDGDSFLWVPVLCQQVVEKAIKALYYYYFGVYAPKIHNIGELLRILTYKVDISILKELYEFSYSLVSHYTYGRCDNVDSESNKFLDKQTTAVILEKTREVYSWFLALIKL